MAHAGGKIINPTKETGEQITKNIIKMLNSHKCPVLRFFKKLVSKSFISLSKAARQFLILVI